MPLALTINPKDDEINATMEDGVLTICHLPSNTSLGAS